MNSQKIQTNLLVKHGKENHKLYSPWSSHVHPFIFLPFCAPNLISSSVLLKTIFDFVNRANGSKRFSGYVMLVIPLFAIALLIFRIVEYLIDMKTIYFNDNKPSSLSDEQTSKLSLVSIMKFYLEKFSYSNFVKITNEYKQNGTIIPSNNIV